MQLKFFQNLDLDLDTDLSVKKCTAIIAIIIIAESRYNSKRIDLKFTTIQ